MNHYATTMNYLGEYTARVFDIQAHEEDWYRPFPSKQAAMQYVEQQHGKVWWLSYREYSRNAHPTKKRRHYLKGGTK